MVDISSSSVGGWYQQCITGWLISAVHHWVVDISSTSLDGWYQQYITGWLISAVYHSPPSKLGWYLIDVVTWKHVLHHWSFVRETTGHRWFPQNAMRRCGDFCLVRLNMLLNKMVALSVFWDALRSYDFAVVLLLTLYIITANYIIQMYIIQYLTISFSVQAQHVIDPVCSGCLSLHWRLAIREGPRSTRGHLQDGIGHLGSTGRPRQLVGHQVPTSVC